MHWWEDARTRKARAVDGENAPVAPHMLGVEQLGSAYQKAYLVRAEGELRVKAGEAERGEREDDGECKEAEGGD